MPRGAENATDSAGQHEAMLTSGHDRAIFASSAIRLFFSSNLCHKLICSWRIESEREKKKERGKRKQNARFTRWAFEDKSNPSAVHGME